MLGTLLELAKGLDRHNVLEQLQIVADALEDAGFKNTKYVRKLALDAKAIVIQVYGHRTNRNTHPEGEFDGARRWFPSDREDLDGSIKRDIRSPSRAWPNQYIKACRSRKHCKVLVEAALRGEDVPPDVVSHVNWAKQSLADKVRSIATDFVNGLNRPQPQEESNVPVTA